MVKRVLQGMLGLLLVAPILALAATPASAGFIGNFKIIAWHSGKCVTLGTNSPPSNGTALRQYTCDGFPDQTWSFYNIGWVNGMPEYEVRSAQFSNFCIDLRLGDFTNGTTVQQWTCNGFTQQHWVQRYFTTINGQPVYELHPFGATNKCLDVRDISQANNAALRLWDCFQPNGQANQLFFTPAA